MTAMRHQHAAAVPAANVSPRLPPQRLLLPLLLVPPALPIVPAAAGLQNAHARPLLPSPLPPLTAVLLCSHS